MPIAQPSRSRTGLFIATALLAAGLQSPVRGAPPAAVGVIRDVPWSPGDASREGAGEFSVLMQIARLQQKGSRAGLLGIGATRGVFAPGTERALRFAVLNGVPVVKLAAGSDVAESPEQLFVNAGSLSESDAQRVLTEALQKLGNAPRAADPSRPTERELVTIRAHVRRLQQAFALAQSNLVARS